MKIHATIAMTLALAACGEQRERPPSAPASQTPAPPPADSGSVPAPPPPSSGPCLGAAPGPGYECLQDCWPPVARAGDPPPPYRWMSPDEVKRRNLGGCPKCLRRGTKIATPSGDVAVEKIRVGDMVFTVDASGRKVATTVRLVSSTPAPRDHRMVRIRLADGRAVVASPGHPTAEGTGMGALSAGATLDHGRIVAVETLALDDDRTFDVLPDGETGRYWGDGILLGSTLSR